MRTAYRLTFATAIASLVVAGNSAPSTAAPGSAPGNARSSAPSSLPNPYFTSSFSVSINSFTFGQDPSWAPDGRVLSVEKDPAGTPQIYVSRLSGSSMSCATCGQPGPNGFPQERPQGDWILFCSYRGQAVTIGSPCLGGIGSDLYVIRPDGTHLTRLTMPGTPQESGVVPYDNYHPYWSPDGHHLIWTHLDFDSRSNGGTQWTILLSTFSTTSAGAPALTGTTVVAPGGDNAYETQVWAPDGSGVLYTSFTSGSDPNSGWLNTELYFLRLFGKGASPAHPVTTHLTDGNAGWDEQAVFTPDMKDVIWMSSRDYPTWFETVVTDAEQARFDPPLENDVAGPFFVLTILDPRFRTDLYEMDLHSHAMRRLTHLDQVVPEFYFDPSGTKILWTTGELSHSYVGEFSPTPPPAHLHPAAIDPRWVHARPPKPGPAPRTVTTLSAVALDIRNLPPQEGDAVQLLETQLGELAQRMQSLPVGGTCCQPPP